MESWSGPFFFDLSLAGHAIWKSVLRVTPGDDDDDDDDGDGDGDGDVDSDTSQSLQENCEAGRGTSMTNLRACNHSQIIFI